MSAITAQTVNFLSSRNDSSSEGGYSGGGDGGYGGEPDAGDGIPF